MRKETNSIGTAIKNARKKKGMTQAQLSEALDISMRYLQSIENENKTPSYALLTRILGYLSLSADSVLLGEESESPDRERLMHLIKYQCTDADIQVLIATAEALLQTKQ